MKTQLCGFIMCILLGTSLLANCTGNVDEPGFEGEVFKQFPIGWTSLSSVGLDNPPYLFSLAIESNGTLWLGTDGDGVYRFDGKTWKHYAAEEGLSGSDFLGSNLYALTVTQDDTVIAGTCGAFYTFNGKSWQPYAENATNEMLEYMCPFSIASDLNNSLWFHIIEADPIGTGLINYTSDGWQNYAAHDAFSNGDGKTFTMINYIELITAVMIDSKGHLWAANETWHPTDDKIVRFDGTNWSTFTDLPDLGEGLVINILENIDGNIIFITTDGVLFEYDGLVVTAYDLPEELIDAGSIVTEIGPDGTFWSIPVWSSQEPGIYRFVLDDLTTR